LLAVGRACRALSLAIKPTTARGNTMKRTRLNNLNDALRFNSDMPVCAPMLMGLARIKSEASLRHHVQQLRQRGTIIATSINHLNLVCYQFKGVE